jgi:organic radical activating enzyme
MSVFDVKKNKAICALPWIHEYKKNDGKIAPCCQGEVLDQNESLAEVRTMMLNNIQPRVCGNCYRTERISNWSHRIHETQDWIKKFGTPDLYNPSLQSLDIRFDPTCNLKCKTCGPHDSTLWQKEKGIKIVPNKTNKEYLQKVDKTKIKKIYLAGGEPTYIKDYIDFLEELFVVNKDCEVVINTNLKKLSDKWKILIQQFPNLSIICSCDAIEVLGNYVRYPLVWTEFEKNVAFVSEHANFLQFNLVASNITAHKMYETCMWMKKYSNNIDLSILHKPEIFSEKAVPKNLRSDYIVNIEKLLKFPISVYYAARFRNEVQLLIKKYTESVYEENLHKKLKTEITDQDSKRSTKLQDVDPFLYSWIYS